MKKLVLDQSYRPLHVYKNLYSITSMAQTRMTRLSWMIQTLVFSPYKILPIAQENKYLMIFSYSIMELYVMCTH